MSKKKTSHYEDNLYSQQLEVAFGEQKNYDSKKVEAKQKVLAESRRQKGLMRTFMFLCALGFAIVAYRLINLDQANSAPITVFIALVTAVFGLAWWINRS